MVCWKRLSIMAPIVASALLASAPVRAGAYADTMAKCIVSGSSEADRRIFVRWLFSAIALNPDVTPMSAISPQQRHAMNKETAALLQRLLTQSCRREVVEAIKYEGPQAVEYAFNVFGQVAGREMFASPHVAQAMTDMQALLEGDEFKKLRAEASGR